MKNMSSILQLKEVGLALSHSGQYLLQDISFTVEKSERLAIIGASGVGKTTLLRLLNRLDEPTSGVITFTEQPLTKIPVIKLRQKVVMIPQEPKLLGMKVQNALMYPLQLQQLSKTAIQQRIEIVQSQLSIPEEWLDRNELQLSLGQRQLVAIARGLVMQPQVLLLDEPTSALDAGSSHHLMETLIKLSHTNATTIIMVNHQLNLVEQFAQQVIYMEKGQIKNKTTAREINWQELRDQLRQIQTKQQLIDTEL
jgi:D-methionine transport system ATP-binding protein